jgi:hypothetical protein
MPVWTEVGGESIVIDGGGNMCDCVELQARSRVSAENTAQAAISHTSALTGYVFQVLQKRHATAGVLHTVGKHLEAGTSASLQKSYAIYRQFI